MMVVGVLTLVVSARGSVELGGATSAMAGLGVAGMGPVIGATADRFGQRPVLLIASAVNTAALVAFVWITLGPAPVWVMFAASFLVGASVPQTSPLSRSRLVTIIMTRLPPLRRPRVLSTVLAYESAADEVVFVFGPVIVGLLASTLGAETPILVAAGLTALVVTGFALHRTGGPVDAPAQRLATRAPASELRRPALVITVVGITAVGLLFGSTLTSLTSAMQDRGEVESAGLLYGVVGVGSAVFAIAAALLPARFSLRSRWLVSALLAVAGGALLWRAGTTGELLVGLAVMGIGVGPLLVTLYSLGAELSPLGRSATVMTLLGSGIMVGQSCAAALTGLVAGVAGTSAALSVPFAAAALALATGAVNRWITPVRP